MISCLKGKGYGKMVYMTFSAGHRQAIAASWITTPQLQRLALSLYQEPELTQPVWNLIAETEAEARAYYADLLANNPEQARDEAAEALAMGGLTMRQLNRTLS